MPPRPLGQWTPGPLSTGPGPGPGPGPTPAIGPRENRKILLNHPGAAL